MKSYRENPEGPEQTEAAKQHEREVFALNMQAKAAHGETWTIQAVSRAFYVQCANVDIAKVYREEDAKLIVRAVNSHEALVSALGLAIDQIPECASRGQYFANGLTAQLSAALANIKREVGE